MPHLLFLAAVVTVAFAIAGMVKGVTGLGLPVVAVGLLGAVMPPASAAALVVMPAFVTNIWQFYAGPHAGRLLARLWPMLAGCSIATFAATGIIVGDQSGGAVATLGFVLIAYAVIGLFRVRFTVAPKYQRWATPVVGVSTGVLAGATGVFTIPAVPYLEAIGLEREDLVQGLGLFFLVSSLSLGVGLAGHGAFHVPTAGESLLCLVPALGGMRMGRWIRVRIRPPVFRTVFLSGLLGLGLDLVLRSLF